MKLTHYASLMGFGISTILFRRKKPILATIILTDACNLSCKHCAVNNLTRYMEKWDDVLREMRALYDEGNRILFFCGGETFSWYDGNKTVKDLVIEAKRIGFFLVNVVTNGTLGLDVPGADIVFLSIDGMRETHNAIRGDTFDTIMENVAKSSQPNVCVYMAINSINRKDVESLATLVRDNPRLKSISFNFHTPYAGTEGLSLTPSEKREVAGKISSLIDRGYPVFNLKASLDRYLSENWKRPCHQCLVSERGKRYVCGRCSEIDGLCDECGYLFAIEFSLLCGGNPRAIVEMLRTYWRFS